MLGAEAGFALDQALKEWSDNPVAKRGAAELEALLGSRRSRAAQLERFAHEHDPRVSSGQRVVVAVALALVGAALSVSSFVVDTRDETTRSLFFQSLGPLGAVSLSALLLRRHLLRTTLNRRMIACTIVLVVFVSADRALGLLAGIAAPQIVVSDCVGLAALCLVGAIAFFRWLSFASVLLFAAAVVGATHPERAVAAFSAATGLALIAGTVVSMRSARAAAGRAR